MEAQPTLSVVNVSESSEWCDEAPLAVKAVLRKIGDTELARARKYIAEEVGIILSRVNTALYGFRLTSTVLEEENGKIVPSSDPNERERRSDRLGDIQNFLMSAEEKKKNLTIVLECLECISDDLSGLENDKDFSEVKNITGEWVAKKEADIWKSMSNIESGVLRLHELCRIFFSIKIEKTTKGKRAGKKANEIWCWWRETRVDAHMLLKIQELQPPSTDRMLNDPELSHKAASDLSFMLEDLAKAHSNNKVMNMAFQFAQNGLNHLSCALKDQSQQVLALQNEVDRLMFQNTTTEVEPLLNRLNMANAQITQLKLESNTLKENNAQLLTQIKGLQEQAHEEKHFMVSPVIAPTPAHAPPKPEYKMPRDKTPRDKTPEDKTPRQEKVNIQPTQVTQVIYIERERSETFNEPVASPVDAPREEPESPKPEEVSVFDEVEKGSKKLLSSFRAYVFGLMKKSIEENMPDQMEKIDLDPHRANDAIQLYHSLQSSLRATFEEIISNMNISFSSGILDLPVVDEHLKQPEYFGNTATPGQMLQDINNTFKTCDEDFEEVLKNIEGLQEGSRDQAESVYQQLHTIHNESRKQSCKMRLLWENLMEVYSDIHPEPKGETERPQHPPKRHLPALPPVAEKPRLRRVSHKEAVPSKALVRVRKSKTVKTNIQQPFEIPQIVAKPFRELLERYEREMVSEGEKIMRDEMGGGKYQLSMGSQMANLRVLHQALLSQDISTELYCFAKDLINYTLRVTEMQLACFMRKFIAHQTLQQVRSNLNVRVFSAREYNDGPALRDLYIFMTKLELYKSSVMQRWRLRQKAIEDERRTCIANMLYLFRQFEQDLGVNLVKPYFSADKSLVQRFPTIKPQLTLNVGCYRRCQSHVPPSPCLVKPEHGAFPQPHVRELAKPRTSATWRFNVTMNNMQLASKQPAMLSIPPTTFPRLLEMDISHCRQRALHMAQDRFQRKIPQ